MSAADIVCGRNECRKDYETIEQHNLRSVTTGLLTETELTDKSINTQKTEYSFCVVFESKVDNKNKKWGRANNNNNKYLPKK